MNTFLATLNSIVFNHPFPDTEDKEYRQKCQAYDAALKQARKITVFTASYKYTGIVTKILDDHFIMNDDKNGDIRVIIAKVESFTFPDQHAVGLVA